MPITAGSGMPRVSPSAALANMFDGPLRSPPGITAPAEGAAATAAERKAHHAGNDDAGSVIDSQAAADKSSERQGPARTKIPTRDFQKFDVDPDAILRGSDKRTTVMVRHLQGAFAR